MIDLTEIGGLVDRLTCHYICVPEKIYGRGKLYSKQLITQFRENFSRLRTPMTCDTDDVGESPISKDLSDQVNTNSTGTILSKPLADVAIAKHGWKTMRNSTSFKDQSEAWKGNGEEWMRG